LPELKIRDIDPSIIKLLDDIVAKEKYSSRNELLQEIVRLYVINRSEYYSKSLVPTIKFLSQEAISEHEIYRQKDTR